MRAPLLYLIVIAGVALVMAPSSLHAAGQTRDNLAALDSLRHDTTALAGHVVYVDFWASWCPPCRQSFPWMIKRAEEHAQRGLKVVAVSVDKKHQDATRFLEKVDPQFEILFDSTGALAERYGLDAMPTSFVYGRDGRLRYNHKGFTPDDEPVLDSVINALLQEKPAP